MINKVIKCIKKPSKIILYLMNTWLFKLMSDKQFLKLKYKLVVGKKLNLEHPKGFNEKLQWLKLNNRKDIFTKMVDKYDVKKIVSEKIGEKYVIPTYQVCEKIEEIDFNSLPDRFVIKTTHDSGGVIVCKNKKDLDKEYVKNKLAKHLKRNYYYSCREWPYKNVKPRILIEELMENEGHDYLPVYKIFCFNGKPTIIQTIQNDKQPNETIDYFDINWNLLEMKQNFPNSESPLEKPEKLLEMLEIAEKLSMDLPFIRVDLYVINNDIYFSEYTFFSDAGFANFEPEYWNVRLGEMIELPQMDI